MTARRDFLIKEERERLQTQLGAHYSGFKVRCVTAVARSILLHGSYVWNERTCNPVAKYMGAGVYEIWLEETK